MNNHLSADQLGAAVFDDWSTINKQSVEQHIAVCPDCYAVVETEKEENPICELIKLHGKDFVLSSLKKLKNEN